jgi:mercuric ion transport protein
MQPTLPGAAPRAPSGVLSYLSLFTSIGTLLCCALPSLLVLFGLRATVASVLSVAPWLVTMSHHKHWVFIVAGLMIIGNLVYVYAIAPNLQARTGACNRNDPAACQTASRFSRIVLWCSAVLYMLGCFTAYFLRADTYSLRFVINVSGSSVAHHIARR